jgi:hypothetical protein
VNPYFDSVILHVCCLIPPVIIHLIRESLFPASAMTIVGISLHAGAIDDTLLFYQHVIMDSESIQSRAIRVTQCL